jgi:hypothetical protein
MITDEQFQLAATKLKCDISDIKAVYEVETQGKGFLPDGRLKILFEGHQFWRLLKKGGFNPLAISQGHENILYPHYDRTQYKGGAHEWDRMSEAIALCKERGIPIWIALDSASYGAFQIMGFNHNLAGFPTSQEMITFMNSQGESGQLTCFVNYILATGLDLPLRKNDWPVYANSYNGPGYRGNPLTVNDDYDHKLAIAKKKYQTAA